MLKSRIALIALGIGMTASLLRAQTGRRAGGPIGRGPAADNPGLQAPTRGTIVASSDDRTNSVVLSGPNDEIERVQKIIDKLDANPAKQTETYFYRLRNGSALNIEAVANMLFNGTNGSGRAAPAAQQNSVSRIGATQLGTSGRGTAARGTGGLSTAGTSLGTSSARGSTATFASSSSTAAGSASALPGPISIVADPSTNTLLITTSPANWPQVRRVVEELDRSLAQVLIKVLIAEVSHSNGSDLGADLSIFDIRLGTDISSGTLNSTVLGSTGKTTFGAPGTGGFLAIAEDNISATLHALQTEGKIDVLSRPYILASDNQPASITVGQTVPYIASSQITNVGNTINTPNYANVGVLLDVVPHINPDGVVIMDVSPEISSVADSTVQIATGLTLPVFNTRSADTHIALKDGQTAVIGGLMQDQINSTVDKVPLLGDIPFIGQAFQRRQDTKTKTELLVFLTPHVVTQPEQLGEMGNSELDTTQLIRGAVSPGTFQAHEKGLEAGAPATQPGTDSQIQSIPPGRSELPEDQENNQDE